MSDLESILRVAGTDPARMKKRLGAAGMLDMLEALTPGYSRGVPERIYALRHGLEAPPKCEVCRSAELTFRSYHEGYLSRTCDDKGCKAIFKTGKKLSRTDGSPRHDLVDVTQHDPEYVLAFVRRHLLRNDGNLNGNLLISATFLDRFGEAEYTKVFSGQLHHGYESFAEYVYYLSNGRPTCVCGRPTNFVNANRGYLRFCSSQCANNDAAKIQYTIDANKTNRDINKRDTRRLKILEKHEHSLATDGFDILGRGEFNSNSTRYTLRCHVCKTVSESTYCDRRCYVCRPLTYMKEAEIAEVFSGETVLTNIRSVLPYKRLQLDVYLPERKLAVEYDGLMYHSYGAGVGGFDNWREEDRSRHAAKTDACEEQGIRLFRVWDVEWNDPTKREIWISLLKNQIGQSTRVFARHCNVVYDFDHRTFMSENHLQGPVRASVKIGLEHEGRLMMAATFGHSRYTSHGWELLRMATRRRHIVVGGASRLITAFANQHPGEVLMSYANRRWSMGGVYEGLGFAHQGRTAPGYFYYKNGQVFSRQQFQKHKLPALLEKFDSNKTEFMNMIEHGYRRVWDCGHLIYSKNM